MTVLPALLKKAPTKPSTRRKFREQRMSQGAKRRREESLVGSKLPLPKVSTKPKSSAQATGIPSARNASTTVPSTPSSTRPRLPSMPTSELRKVQASATKPSQIGRMKSISNANSLRTPLTNRTNLAGLEGSERRVSLQSQLKTPSTVSNRLSTSTVTRPEHLRREKLQLDDETPMEIKKRRVTSETSEELPASIEAEQEKENFASLHQLGSDFNEIDALHVDFTEVPTRPVEEEVKEAKEEEIEKETKDNASEEQPAVQEISGEAVSEEARNEDVNEEIKNDVETAPVVSDVQSIVEDKQDEVKEEESAKEVKEEAKEEKEEIEKMQIIEEIKVVDITEREEDSAAAEKLQQEFEEKIQDLELNWKQKYAKLEEDQEEEKRKIRAALKQKESELHQAIALSDELMSQAEEVGKKYKILEAKKQEEIAKALFTESEKYERMLASLRAELQKQEQIKSKVEEMDRLRKDQEEEASAVLAQLKGELEQAKETESKSLAAIKSLEESLQLADKAWKAKFEALQASGERIIIDQSEKYEKLIAELEQQLKEKKACIEEQYAHADEQAEDSHHSDTVWMLKFEEIYKEKEDIAAQLEKERAQSQLALKNAEEAFARRISEMELQWQANSGRLIKEKEELAAMAAQQKESYENLMTELRAELEKLRDKENASSEARLAFEEELTERAVAMEADWRKRFEDLANKKQEEISQVESHSSQLEQTVVSLQSQLEAYKAKEIEWQATTNSFEAASKRIESMEQILKDQEQMLGQVQEEMESSRAEFEKKLSEAKEETEQAKAKSDSLEASWQDKYDTAMRLKVAEADELLKAQKAAEAAKEELQSELQSVRESELCLANEKEEMEEELRQKAEALEAEWTAKYDEIVKANKALTESSEAQKAELEALLAQLRVELEQAKEKEQAAIKEKAILEEETNKKIESMEAAWNERLQEVEETKTREAQSAISEQKGENEKIVADLKAQIEEIKQKEVLTEESRQSEIEEIKTQANIALEAVEEKWKAKSEELTKLHEEKLQKALEMQKAEYESEMEILRSRIESLKEREDAVVGERDEIQREMQRKVEAIESEWNAKFEDVIKNKDGETQGLIGQIQERHEKIVSELKEEVESYRQRIVVVVNDKEILEKELLGRIEEVEASWREKYAQIVKEKEQELETTAGSQKEEYEGIVSSLKQAIESLTEEKESIAKEKETLESELRAALRSTESNWNERYLEMVSKKDEERLSAIEAIKEEYDDLLVKLRAEIEALNDKQISSSKDVEAEWKRQMEFMEHSWNERLEETLAAKDEEAQKLVEIEKEKYESAILVLNTEIEALNEKHKSFAKERADVEADWKRQMEFMEHSWNERLEEALAAKDEEAQKLIEIEKDKHESAMLALTTEIEVFREQEEASAKEREEEIAEMRRKSEAMAAELDSRWNEQFEALSLKNDEALKEAVAAAEELRDKVVGELKAEVEALKAATTLSAEKDTAVFAELKQKKKAAKAQWKLRRRIVSIQKEEELKETVAALKEEYNVVIDGLQAALEAARSREALIAAENRRMEAEIQNKMKDLEASWDGKYQELESKQKEEIKQLKGALEEGYMQKMQEVQEQMEKVRKEGEEELAEKEKEIAAVRLALTQLEQNNKRVGQGMDRMKAKMLAIQMLGEVEPLPEQDSLGQLQSNASSQNM